MVPHWSLPAYLDVLYNARSRDGLFASKIQFRQFEMFLTNETGQRLFHDAVVVKLCRSDVRAQFVSEATATTYDHWSDTTPTRTVADDPQNTSLNIRSSLRRCLENEAGWHAFFGLSGIVPMLVTDQMMIEDMAGVIRRIAQRLGRPVDEDALQALAANDKGRYTAQKEEKARIAAQAERMLQPHAFNINTYRNTRYPRPHRSLRTRLKHRLFGRPVEFCVQPTFYRNCAHAKKMRRALAHRISITSVGSGTAY